MPTKFTSYISGVFNMIHPTARVLTALLLPFIYARSSAPSMNHCWKYLISKAEAQEYGFSFCLKPFERHF